MSHNDTAKVQKLLSKILHYFSEDYVLDPVHSYWKEMLLTNDGWVTAQQLATFPDVMIEADEGASTVLDVASQSGGQLLVDTNRRCVKRAIPIDLAQDPLRRTICVRPIHANATDEEIKAFFLPYGPVKRVERQTFTDFESQKSRKRPWAFVQFEDEGALERCLIDKPTFGTLPNFGQHFIPKLSVSRRKDFETLMTIEANEHYEWNKREHLLQKKSVAHADIGNKKVTTQPLADTTTETDVPSTHVKRVPEGSILILPDLPSGVSWRELKSTLGAIAKGVCLIVYILTDSEMNNVTYIFMKNSIGAQRVLDRYHVEAAENETLRTQIPQMSIATLAQEARAKQLYEGGGGSQQIERKRKENIEWRKKQEGEKKVKKTYSPSFQ